MQGEQHARRYRRSVLAEKEPWRGAFVEGDAGAFAGNVANAGRRTTQTPTQVFDRFKHAAQFGGHGPRDDAGAEGKVKGAHRCARGPEEL